MLGAGAKWSAISQDEGETGESWDLEEGHGFQRLYGSPRERSGAHGAVCRVHKGEALPEMVAGGGRARASKALFTHLQHVVG